MEYANNQTWYVTFGTEEDALAAYSYLRDEVKHFKVMLLKGLIKAIKTEVMCCDNIIHEYYVVVVGKVTIFIHILECKNLCFCRDLWKDFFFAK